MDKLLISVCMIAGAEAGRIGRALESVAGWTSEIIVVLNAEVSDGTDIIAQSHSAKVFREVWKGFEGPKNSALAKALQSRVFKLEADEVVARELQPELQRIFLLGRKFLDPDKLERFRQTLNAERVNGVIRYR